MAYRGTIFQMLALATVVLTQSLGACYCAAIEDVCRPLACAQDSTPNETDCCSDQPEQEEGLACCAQLELGWSLLPISYVTPVPGPAMVRPADFGAVPETGLPPGEGGPTAQRPGYDRNLPACPVRTLFCVRLI